MQLRRFTRRELAQFNGQNGAPTFIAYQGRVYDVSSSFLWRNGRHQARQMGGMDLTDMLDHAPHGAEMLDRFPIVGTL